MSDAAAAGVPAGITDVGAPAHHWCPVCVNVPVTKDGDLCGWCQFTPSDYGAVTAEAMCSHGPHLRGSAPSVCDGCLSTTGSSGE